MKRTIVIFLLLLSSLFCFTVHAKEQKQMRVAILYFENNSSKSELAPLAKGLCDMMISDMSENKHIAVVERTRLEDVLKELKLSNSKGFDKNTAARIGKLLGAEYLVLGSFFEFGRRFRIDARMVHVETGRICVSAGEMGKADNFDEIEQKVVRRLLTKLPGINANVHSKPSSGKTKVSVATVTKYGDALNKIDNGDKKKAHKILSEVVSESPDFLLAVNTLKEISGD